MHEITFKKPNLDCAGETSENEARDSPFDEDRIVKH